jgi:predicted aspartyl protease
MITGQVNRFYEAVIRLTLQDPAGVLHEVEAILDTGFNGTLTLSPAAITAWQLPWRTRGRALLANGAEETFDIYAATILWDGMPRPILVEAVETIPLVGMGLLVDCEVWLRVQPGGMVQISAGSPSENPRTS